MTVSGLEEHYSGLYSLLRLCQDPCENEVEDAINKLIKFINIPYDKEDQTLKRNEMFFVKVFKALKNTESTKIMEKMLQVI